jgi:hypothetical protein
MAKTGTPLNTLIRDDNTTAVQIGSSIQTSDATATPQNSPLAFSNTVITIVIPDNAVEFIVAPSKDLRVSELANMSTYDVVATGTKEAIPCARMQNIYIVRDSADGTLNFRFTLV